jgi:ADP-heptose:LPS heptosyltransferase
LFTKRVEVRSERDDRTTHWTQVLLDYARALDCDVADATPRFVLDDLARKDARATLAAAGITGAYGILHPTRGIAAARERWPRESLGELGRAAIARFGVPLVVTGTAVDAPIADAVARIAGATSLAGQTSIRSFGALAEGARYVVAMDSGPMHVAAAVGAPTVGIFALRSDEPERWRPLGPRTALVRGSYPCPPSHRKETCPDFACIRALDIATVLDAIARL